MIAIPANENTAKVCEYLTQKTSAVFDPALCTAFAIMSDKSEFVAGVVLSNWRKHDIEISCATESSMAWRPHVMKAVFQYVYDQLGCTRCTSIVTKSNSKCRTFLNDLGFTLEGNLRMGYDGKRDALIYGMLRAECRYLKGV